jgi:hypothetical protein
MLSVVEAWHSFVRFFERSKKRTKKNLFAKAARREHFRVILAVGSLRRVSSAAHHQLA